MKTNLQYLLGRLAEEAAEIGQIACKTSDFGQDEVCPGQAYTNFERCHAELNDLLGVVRSLNEQCGFNFVPSEHAILNKQAKIEKYKAYAKSLGMVEDLDTPLRKAENFHIQADNVNKLASPAVFDWPVYPATQQEE